MSSTNENLLDAPRKMFAEISAWWKSQPDKGLFFLLFAAWTLLFHFCGNSILGYHKTSSLFEWMYFVFTTSADDPHCLYVPLVVLALFYWKRAELIRVRKDTWWPALGIVVFSLMLHVIGFFVQQTRVSIVAFFLGAYGLMGLVWGREWLRHTFFPMILCGFCVPLGTMAETITLPLRIISSKMAVAFTHGVLGVDVVRDGVQIFDSGRTFSYEVAAACSGIRSLLTLLALSTVLAFVSFTKNWKRLVLIASAVPLAVLGNVLRLTTIIVVAEAFGQNAGTYIETKFGFVTYILALVVLLLVSHWLRERDPSGTMPPAMPQPG